MDADLKAELEYILRRLERKNDELADTPKRHKISEAIQNIRLIIALPTSPGYER